MDFFFIDIITAPSHKSLSDLELNDQRGYEIFKDKYSNVDDLSDLSDLYDQNAHLYSAFGKIVSFSCGYIKDNEPLIKIVTGEEIEILTYIRDILNKVTNRKISGVNLNFYIIPWITHKMYKYGLEMPHNINFIGKKPWEYNTLDITELWRIKSPYISVSEICYELGINYPSTSTLSEVSNFLDTNDIPKLEKIARDKIIAVIELGKKIYKTQ